MMGGEKVQEEKKIAEKQPEWSEGQGLKIKKICKRVIARSRDIVFAISRREGSKVGVKG